jgi:hypothetical protein
VSGIEKLNTSMEKLLGSYSGTRNASGSNDRQNGINCRQ